MAELTDTISIVPGCRWILPDLEKIMACTRMQFKSTKSISLVFNRWIMIEKFRFKFVRTIILSLKNKPVNGQCKIFNADLKYRNATNNCFIDLEAMLIEVDIVRAARSF